MAGKYSKQEIKEKLRRSVFHIVTTEGIERLSVRRISAGCGLSDPYIYQCYSDVPDLLADAFMQIDGEVADLVQDIVKKRIKDSDFDKEADIDYRLIWNPYWEYLMENPERTVFYWRYYQSGYYSEELHAIRKKNYSIFADYIRSNGKALGLSDSAVLEAIVSNIIDTSVLTAIKIHLGYLTSDAMSEDEIYGSVFAPLFYLIRERMRKNKQQ